MKAIRRTAFEACVLVLAGVVIGFGYNSVRAKGSIDLHKDYFAKGPGDQPYEEVSFAEVVDLLNDPDTDLGLNVFVDARSSELYVEGHMPGAVWCDPYETEAHIDDVLGVAAAADKVIVYCSGGECEDSFFMCRELLEAGIARKAIYVYPGGWNEWIERGQPVEQEWDE
ncbi:MAG: rhodanese-like domain-containing protein [Planctomycetota bacterium]|jgi:rhodanese-related sulfurtransferase